ncbi:MAG: TraR/DksA C4-type zinc finger protein [Actinomycetota bacterium]|nr:TraR/DksA C4-type zinc finger protein [Actinomycetota bacterium]
MHPRQTLVRHRAALNAELKLATAAVVEARRLRSNGFDDDEHDPDGDPLSAEWARLESLRRAAELRIVAADEAIANFDAGNYGTCVVCGQAIAPGRLQASPTATRCVSCADRRI